MKTKEERAKRVALWRANMSEERKKQIRDRENKRRREKHKTLDKAEKDKRAERFKRWYEKNKKAYIKRVTKYRDERLKRDPAFRLQWLCRKRLRKAMHAQGQKKRAKSIDLIGCSPNELKAYLEKRFDSNMTWENYGSYWHVDHIIPCAAFDLSKEEEQKKCFHYSNLQPLEAKANIKKGSTLPDASLVIETVSS